MTTEVWISTRGRNPEATSLIIQEALQAENSKDTPSFGTEDLEKIHLRYRGGPIGHLLLPIGSLWHGRFKRQEVHGG